MQKNDTHKMTRLEQILGLTALFLLLIACFVVMRPFLTAVLWAVVMGFSLWPVQCRLTSWLGNRRTLAALLTTLTITLVLVVPFAVIGFSLADDARALGQATAKWIEAGPPAPPAWLEKIPIVGGQAKVYWNEFAKDSADLMEKLKQADTVPTSPTNGVEALIEEPGPSGKPPPALASMDESRLVQALKRLLSSTRTWLFRAGLAIGRGAAEVALSVLLTFFMLRNGVAVAKRLNTGVGRIAGEQGKHLLVVAGQTVRGVVYGILGTALVQGVMAGIGFLIAGVPGAALLGLLTFFLSVVPVGPPLVWIPAVIWLFQQGETGWGVFMLVWGVGVSSVDNVVKPWLISQGSHMPFVLIFFGVLGGALAFGFIGVFLGPTLLAVAYRLIEEWSAVSTSASGLGDGPAAAEAGPVEGLGA